MIRPITDRIDEVETNFKDLETENPRQAAELAYVLAKLYGEAGNRELSETYAKISVSLLEHAKISSLEDAAAYYSVVADICVPSYFHENVVRRAFSEYNL